tara:strand:- start:3981 stop:4343 length:363 start_codon:yes stop_codon:yes gene_type:complete
MFNLTPKISRDELKSQINSGKEFILLDVRQKGELMHGMLPGAKHICIEEIDEALKLNPHEFKERYGFVMGKDSEIVCYCKSGERSKIVANLLLSEGFTNVKDYSGSVEDWSKIDSNVKCY